MKAKIIIIAVMLLLGIGMIYPVSAQGPNYMGFDASTTHTTIGESPTVDVWVDVSSSIDTASVDNLTFLPAGIVHYTSTAQGDLFAGTIVWLTPEDNGEVNNESGYANYGITWAHTTPVNNTNGTLATITWLAHDVGTATLTITAGGTALGGIDPGTTKYTGTIVVHPEEPINLVATPAGITQIDLTWTKQTGMDKTLIRYRTDTFPTSVTDGTELYNNTGSSTSHGGLSPGDHIFYSAWGWNDTGGLYSLLYDTDDALTNSPPVFGTPSPTNGSANRELSLTWSIPISDPEGNSFNWEIECSNGQRSFANGASNGTKQLAISGLAYSTAYTVWANATDPGGSGTWAREWFTFTTKANSPPDEPDGDTDTTPRNNAPNVPINIGFLRVVVTDPDGHDMDVDFYWGNDTLIGTDTNVGDGETARISIPTLALNTTYEWYVNVSDGYGGITRGPNVGVWNFTTSSAPPVEGGAPGIIFHNVYVLVIDSITELPIEGALVQAWDDYGTEKQDLQDNGITNTFGTWSTELKDDNEYTIVVTANGYITSETIITVDGEDVFLTVRLAREVAPAGLMTEQGILTTYGYLVLIGAILAIFILFLIWYERKH